MVKKENKQLRAIKRNRTGFSIFLYVFIFLCVTVVMLLCTVMLINYVIGATLSSEYENVSYLAKIYERGRTENVEVEDILTLSDRSFFVLDEQGSVIGEHGKNTASSEKGTYFLTILADQAEFYLDKESDWISVDREDGSIDVDFGNMAKTIKEAWNNYFMGVAEKVSELEESKEEPGSFSFKVSEEEVEYQVTLTSDNVKLAQFPVWISVPILDGKETFVGKALVLINLDDVILVLVVGIFVMAFMLLLLIILIINLIHGAHRQRKAIDTFLTDPVTKGHNWTWFMIKQEPLVQSSWYADKKFAVIELVFVNYRNFCTCHSLLEGERMLQKISEVINKSLAKGEASAHVSTSAFAIVMRFEDEERLRTRLRGLIEVLENIDSTHKFAFHVGVDLVDVWKKENGKLMRRKKLSLEEEYNNACTARSTLAESDDSRIAFFDQKLVEERKWVDAVQERQEKAVKNEEFLVYYQPKYDPKTGKLRGAEALIRWNSPELGFTPPGKFIPIFEKNGFITEIDHYMIRHVAKDQKAWLDMGLDCVPISVNVSRAHFIESNLAEQICRMVDEAGAPRELIEIELTESAFFDDKNAMIKTILKLKEFGFMVSMDDFGAGYSSLNSLKDMPLDVLKLDADFFRGETEGGRGEIVVSEAIRLAKSLKMHTVAEGVEEKEQVDFLARQGCDMIQGYYFAKPMPKEDYLERLKTGIADKAQERKETEPEPVEGLRTAEAEAPEAKPQKAEVAEAAEAEAPEAKPQEEEVAEAAEAEQAASEESKAEDGREESMDGPEDEGEQGKGTEE